MPTSSTRKPASTNNARPARKKPTRVSFNLDTLQRPKNEVVQEPFAFTAGGQNLVMTDVRDMDWQDLAAAGNNPVVVFEKAMSESDFKAFVKVRVPGWKIRELYKAYLIHYGATEEQVANL